MLAQELIDMGFSLKDGCLKAPSLKNVMITPLSGRRCKISIAGGGEYIVKGVDRVVITSMKVSGAGKVGIDLG